MAIYHFSAQVIKRSAGRSAVACAAYRSGERLYDERLGQEFDYRRRRGVEAWVQAPEPAPAWVADRETLWNRAEAAERRCDAQVARELNVALPVELDRDAQRVLVRDWVHDHCVARGMVADVALHHSDPGNPHAHVLLTLREAQGDGFGLKARDWNQREVVETWREAWAREANRALERDGHRERIDHRSHEARGIDHLPEVHEGPHVRALEARGIPTERGDWNRLAREDRALGQALTQTRGELRVAEQGRWVAQREVHWRAAGYDQDTARATARVERELGRTFADDRTARDALRGEVARSGWNGEALRDEAARLTWARRTLESREQWTATLAEHETVRRRLERLVSRAARDAYEQAQMNVHHAEHTFQATGITGRDDLDERVRGWEARQRAWERDRDARIAPMAAVADRFDAAIRERAAQERGHTRERDHQRDRGMERDW